MHGCRALIVFSRYFGTKVYDENLLIKIVTLDIVLLLLIDREIESESIATVVS